MKAKIKKMECKKCGHTWIPRIADVRICPKCKSYRFEEVKKEVM